VSHRDLQVADHVDTFRRAGLRRDGDTIRLGPFFVGFDHESTSPFRNYAVPDPGADPRPEDVERLVVCFRERGRIPRLEYSPACAPAVEAALVDAGFVVEARPTVMTCRPGAHTVLPDVEGVRVAEVQPDAGVDVAGACLVAHVAFEEEGMPDERDLRRLARTISSGGGAVLARAERDDEPIGSAHFPAPALPAGDALDGAPSAEIVGVAVEEHHRRFGVGGLLVSRLLDLAERQGVSTAWLVLQSGEAERVYARAGFRRAAEALHLRLPGLVHL
jgi:GNAT superfamily N-acetyltransferase